MKSAVPIFLFIILISLIGLTTPLFKYLLIGFLGFIIFYASIKIIFNFKSIAKKIKFTKFLNGKRSISGIPDIAVEHWNIQERDFTCAIATQSLVLKIFGLFKNEKDLSERQKAYGEFHESKGSTSITTLTEIYGIKTYELESSIQNLIYDMWKKLDEGCLLLFKVNSYLLNNIDSSCASDKKPVFDHVILVTGMASSNRNTYIFYSDSGINDGSLKSIASRDFINAASRSFFFTVTIPNFERKKNLFKYEEIKKIVICSCKQKLTFPFGKSLKVNCNRCGNLIQIVEPIYTISERAREYVNDFELDRKTTETQKRLLNLCNGNTRTVTNLINYEVSISLEKIDRFEAMIRAIERLENDRR